MPFGGIKNVGGRISPIQSIVRRIITSRNIPPDIKEIVKEGYVALIFSVITCFIPGIILGKITGLLEYLPGLIILIPGAIATRGNVFSTLASRLSTKLHLGELSPIFRRNKILRDNIHVIITQTFIMALLLSSFAKIISYILGIHIISYQELSLIAVIGAMIAAPILLIITIVIAFITFRKGLDPDNFSCPVITAAGDALALPCLVLAAHIVILMPENWVNAFFVIIIILTIISIILGSKSTRARILKESIPILGICALINIISGSILEANLTTVVTYASILILLPPFNEESGNMGGILSARLSSAMHIGVEELTGRKYVWSNAIAILILALMIYPTLGVAAYILSTILEITSLPLIKMILLTLGAGMLVSLCSIGMGIYLTILSYRLGLDPDNIVIPLITSGMDLLSTGTVIIFLTFLAL